MRESYFHGIRTLLLQTIVSTSECSKLSDLIIAQCKLLNLSCVYSIVIFQLASVGTVVNNEGEDDVFGFATVLPNECLQVFQIYHMKKRIHYLL
jgi:hypothetical protein